MKKISAICLLTSALMFPLRLTYGQRIDSTQSESSIPVNRKHLYRYMVPVTLISAGAITLLDKDGDESGFNNLEVQEERFENFRNFSTHADDYLQHAPSIATFILSVSGVKGKNDLANQTAIYLKSELLMLATVYSLKTTVGESRPDSGSRNSFPSGHTAQAFVAATFLSREYGHRSPWISIGAYSVATTVGACRILNDRHWLSDVFVGAGIGILSTNIVFTTHKNRWSHGTRVNALKVNAFSSLGANGISVSYKFI